MKTKLSRFLLIILAVACQSTMGGCQKKPEDNSNNEEQSAQVEHNFPKAQDVVPVTVPSDDAKSLIDAATEGDIKKLRFLLAEGADVNAKGDKGITALSVSSTNGHTGIVKLLLENKANVNSRDNFGATSLMMATMGGHTEAVKVLLKSKPDVNAIEYGGATAFFIASGMRHQIIAKLLESAGKEQIVRKRCERLYYGYHQNGRFSRFKEMQSKLASGEKLHNIEIGEGKVVRKKIATEVDDTTAKSYYENAKRSFLGGDIEIEKDAWGNTYKMVISSEEISVLSSGPDGKEDTKDDITFPSAENYDFNENNILLYVAAKKGDINAVRTQTSKGANVNAKDTDGVTALWQASRKGHTEIVKFLLDSKADVNLRNIDGITALWMAAMGGHMESVKILLESKADVNTKYTSNGASALWMAAQNGHTETVNLLLEAKADVNSKAYSDGKDLTPLSIAKQKGHTKIVKLLEEYGAKG